jgi:hypothetical protein
MQKFSRWMPPLPPSPPLRIRDWIILIALLGGILAIVVGAVVQSPVSAGIVFLVSLLLWAVASRTGGRDDLRLVSERKGDDIGTFTRAFDRRSEPFDPWVVRATWDALQPYVSFPLRPTDRLIEDLGIADEEIDMALLGEVAERSRHSLDDLEANPYFAKFSAFRNVTVGDFVKLISCQPRIEAGPDLDFNQANSPVAGEGRI